MCPSGATCLPAHSCFNELVVGTVSIMCPSGATCLPAHSCFNELAIYKPNSVCWFSTKQTSSSSHQR
jgi:hypothetical protein